MREIEIHLKNILIFFYFSCSLIIPSGYTIAAALISITSVVHFKKWKFKKVDSEGVLLMILLLTTGIMWQHEFNDILSFNNRDIFLKYLLGCFSLIYLCSCDFDSKYIFCGLSAGGIPIAIFSIYQYFELGRATGYTNAIQFSGMAITFATFCIISIFHLNQTTRNRIILIISGAGFYLTSLLSMTRGSWIILIITPLFLLRPGNAKKFIFSSLLVVAFFIFSIYQIPNFQARIDSVKIETKNYLSNPLDFATTSVGQRLEQWKLAIILFKEKPVFGWGNPGYENQKRILVESNKIHPSVTNYNHSHNEILDMGARRGLVGLTILAGIYIWPLVIFFKIKNNNKNSESPDKDKIKTLCLMGISLPIAYFIFGLTQVFFAHNNGHIFYIFSNVFIYAGIKSLENTPRYANALFNQAR